MVSKLYAGRDKDIEFISVALKTGIVDPKRIQSLIMTTPIENTMKEIALARLNRLITTSL